ncbi:interferon alpha-inducible protein 27-like protein 2 [Callorhinus ursinus]|uniref:interferon alpha-inducible protein 27-like protein 2 n=1 Tax=Callorhinus ursinus TaxID=34884 RepID=UPI003CD02F62
MDPQGPELRRSLCLSPLFGSAERAVAGAVLGGVVAVAAPPVVLSAVGFIRAGITAASLAAKMMSATANANGSGVPAGSLVATLQSVGAAGLSTSSKILLGSVGSAFRGWFGRSKKAPPSPPEEAEAEEKEPEEKESQVEPPKPPVGSKKHEKQRSCADTPP